MAHVWFLTRMNSLMLSEERTVTKCLSTVNTFKGSLSGVNSLMLSQVCDLAEGFFYTLDTGKVSLQCALSDAEQDVRSG